MIITDFRLFCEEANIGDIMKIKGSTASELLQSIEQKRIKKFDKSQKLPTFIKLENGQTLECSWYDTAVHDLVDRISSRTNFRSIEDFVDAMKSEMSVVFPNMVGKELLKTGRYSLYLVEWNSSLIVEFDLNKNMGKNFFISVVTVLPGRVGKDVISIIDVSSANPY